MESNISDAELSETLKPLSAKNKFFSKLGMIFIVIMMLIFAIMIFSAIVMQNFFMVFFILFPVSGIIAAIFFKIASIYSKVKKQLIIDIVQDALKNNFELLEYHPDEHISKVTVLESKLFNWNRINGSDLFHANYRGVGFMFSDLQLRSKRKKQTITIFSGQWLVINMGKEIDPSVTVTELSGKSLAGDKRSKVQMESEAFNKEFAVFTENAHKAFYVLTPHFMEFIMSLKQFTESRIHLCFTKNIASIAINTRRDSFEPYQCEQDIAALRVRIQNEVDFIKRIVDGFLRNEQLFDPKSDNAKA